MKITKYEHACLVLEEQGSRLVIDPGDFSNSLPELSEVVGIIVSHIHFDHLNIDRIQRIVSQNPTARIISVSQSKEQLPTAEVFRGNDRLAVGPFKLEFFGGEHAIIHPDYPKFENIGVMVNDVFYYGGDALIAPEKPITLLAVPTSGPWSKTSEQMDYLVNCKPQIAIPVHDFLSSNAGNDSQDRWLGGHAEKHGILYKHLAIGESIEI